MYFYHIQGINDLWELVQCLSEVPVSMGGDAAQARASPRVQAALVRQARGHLEKWLVLARLDGYICRVCC